MKEQPKRDIYPISQISGYNVDYSEFARMEAMNELLNLFIYLSDIVTNVSIY